MLAIISPHPDDDVICCGGVIHRNPDNIMVIYVTDGSKGSPKPEERGKDLALKRMNEAYSALSLLGVKNKGNIIFLGNEDGGVKRNFAKVYDQLLNILRRDDITEMYFPSPLDIHPDHSVTGKIILSFVKRGLIGRGKKMFMYTIHEPPILSIRYPRYLVGLIMTKLTWSRVCLRVDDPKLKVEALKAHESQFWYLPDKLKLRVGEEYECFYYKAY